MIVTLVINIELDHQHKPNYCITLQWVHTSQSSRELCKSKLVSVVLVL